MCDEIKVSSSKTLLLTPQKLTVPISVLLGGELVDLAYHLVKIEEEFDFHC